MALVNKQDPKKIFASQAPSQDVPAEFNNYERGWDESRKNNGKPTIKQFNKLQQLTDEKILWMHQNGAALPFDETIEYADGAVVVKDGKLQQWKDGEWKSVIADGLSNTIQTFNTPEAGVDPVTGVADGAYFNVHSTDEDSMLIEYQNIGGGAIATGRSYPSSQVVKELQDDIEIQKQLNDEQKKINSRFVTVQDYYAVGDGVLRPVSDLYTVGSVAYNAKFKSFSDVQSVLTAATDPSDPLDWCAIQTMINLVASRQFKINLSDKYYHIGDKTLEIKQPIVMVGSSNLGIGGSLINYNGSGSAIRLKKDNFDFEDYSKWIYGAVLTDFGIRGLGGNCDKALELWGCSECTFDRLTIGGTSKSKFRTAVELNKCSINTFNSMVASYNDVMYDFKVAPVSRYKTNAATTIIGGDYYENTVMFKMNSVSGFVLHGAWVESCDQIFLFDDQFGEIECENIAATHNNFVMNTTTAAEIVSLKNGVGKKSRVLAAVLDGNIFRYTSSPSNANPPINLSSLESDVYNIFDFTVTNNKYYGRAQGLTTSDSTRNQLWMSNNRSMNNTYKNVIPDSVPSAVFTGSSQHTRGNSFSIGRSNKDRGAATLIIDDANGSSSSMAIYQKSGSFVPLVNLYNSSGILISSLNSDGSASFSSVKLAVNSLKNLNGTPSSGSYVVGDRILNSEPSISKPVTEWVCISISPLTWQQSAHIAYKGTTAQRPILLLRDQGVQYFDTTLAANGKPIWWTGSAWVDAMGTIV